MNSRYPEPLAVTMLPSRTACRVRGIQVHGDTQQALPGQRVALNLVGDAVAALDRGEMLGVEGRFGQTLRFMMTFTYLGREGAKPRVLESGARVHVMAGTAEVVGRIMLMEGEAPMAVGETRTVQVRLEEPLPLRAGDHAVVLSYSPVMLIGGGRVLLSRCRRSRELAEGERALYVALEAGDIACAVDAWLALQALPVAAADVTAALDLVAGEAEAALRELAACLKSEMSALICKPYPHFRKEYCGEITAVQDGGVISVYADYYINHVGDYDLQLSQAYFKPEGEKEYRIYEPDPRDIEYYYAEANGSCYRKAG